MGGGGMGQMTEEEMINAAIAASLEQPAQSQPEASPQVDP